MGPLKDIREEKFCWITVSEGGRPGARWLKAGYETTGDPKRDNREGCRLDGTPYIRSRITELRDAVYARIAASSLRTAAGRAAQAEERHLKLNQVIRARAEEMSERAGEVDAKGEPVYVPPGGETGLLAMTGDGEYKVDISILKEQRAIERHIAEQLGQLISRSESKLDITLDVLDDGALDRLIAEAERAKATIEMVPGIEGGFGVLGAAVGVREVTTGVTADGTPDDDDWDRTVADVAGMAERSRSPALPEDRPIRVPTRLFSGRRRLKQTEEEPD